MDTGRLEAFSDGVIAVAITLLVLDLAVPQPHAHPAHSLAYQLGREWPRYAAYVVSFATIGIVWINHHAAIARLRQTDHAILVLNLLLLMSIGVLPFATSLMAAYLQHTGSDQQLAAALYAGAFLLMALAFAALDVYILLLKSQLLGEQLPRDQRVQILRWAITGLVPYAVATAIAPLSPYATLAICGAVAMFYALPIASGTGRGAAAIGPGPDVQ